MRILDCDSKKKIRQHNPLINQRRSLNLQKLRFAITEMMIKF